MFADGGCRNQHGSPPSAAVHKYCVNAVPLGRLSTHFADNKLWGIPDVVDVLWYFLGCGDSIRSMCILRGRSNDFVTAGIACLVFFVSGAA